MSLRIEQLAAAKTCIVAGSGKTLMRLGTADQAGATELADALALGRADIMAVNFTVCFIPQRVQHLASLHFYEVDGFRAARRGLDYCYGWDAPETHSNRAHAGVDRVWPEYDNELGRQGTSALFAVKVALALGYERVIVVGVPLDDAGRFYDPPGMPPTAHGKYGIKSLRDPWVTAAADLFAGRVTSMGDHWTAQLLGHPTPEGA